MRAAIAVLPLLASAMLLAACGDAQDKPTGPRAGADGRLVYGDIAFEPCSLSAAGNITVEAQCGSLEVPEDHDAPEGRKISLGIALVPARGTAEPDPVYFIAGGPGQSAISSYPLLHSAISDLRRTRHVLLVDARGTGKSNLLACPFDDDDMADADDLYSTGRMEAFTRECRDRLSEHSDLRLYTTTDHIRDLDLVRARIGVDKVNLIGVSYGTRVAQQFAAAYPQHTRSLVLDSVAPNTLVLGQEHARNLEDALQVQFERCKADEACNRQIGDPRALLDQVRKALEAGGIGPVRYRDAVTGEFREEVPRFGHLASLLRMYAYQPAMAASLPLLLHEASQGRYESLLAQSRMLVADMTDMIALGMSLSVTCSEDADEFSSREQDNDTVLGNSLVEMMQAQCAIWPRGKRPEHFRTPLSGDVPVLALSGEYDPVTPSRYGDEVIAHLPNGRHLVLPGQGHSVLATGCTPKLIAQFLESSDAKALDATCLDRLVAQPPFAGHYGWEP